MKKRVLLLFSLLLSIASSSQIFAPIGAKWHYTVRWAWAQAMEESYSTINATKDTLINGKLCTEIISSNTFCGSYASSKSWLYSEDSIVYFCNNIVNNFQVLYHFKAHKNDSWKIIYPTDLNKIDSINVQVDSTSNTIINSTILKVLHVTYRCLSDTTLKYPGIIIEKIGDVNYFFNFFNNQIICDASYPAGLRCYEDSIFGHFSTGIADSCKHIYHVGINDFQKNDEKYSIFPNPTKDHIFIQNNNDEDSKTIVIYSSCGEILIKKTFNKAIDIDLSSLCIGIYFIKITDHHNNVSNTYKISKM